MTKEEREELIEDMCDNYCKHGHLEDEDMMQEICGTCPLNKLMQELEVERSSECQRGEDMSHRDEKLDAMSGKNVEITTYDRPRVAASNLMRCFPGSFMNQRFELIVHQRTNQYICLEDCHTGDDVVAKSVEWLSRAAAKGHPYDKERNNRAFREMMQKGLNEFWGTDFPQEDFCKIYQHLGNAVNHEKTMRFVRSGFDMQELEVSYGGDK